MTSGSGSSTARPHELKKDVQYGSQWKKQKNNQLPILYVLMTQIKVSRHLYIVSQLSLNNTLTSISIIHTGCPVGWGYRIHRLHLCRGVRPPTPGHDTKLSDRVIPVMQKFWEMRSNLSLPSLPGPLCPGVVAPDRAPSMGQIGLNCVLILN